VAEAGNILTFDLQLLTPEDSDGTGLITFNIGADVGLTASFPANPIFSQHAAMYTVLGSQSGMVTITDLLFSNTVLESIVGLPMFPFDPIINVTVANDNTAPTISTVTQTGNAIWQRYVRAGDTVTYDINFSESVDISINSSSTATNLASNPMTEISGLGVTSAQLVFPIVAGDNGEIVPVVDFDITDSAGNTTNIVDLSPITGGGFDDKIFADTIAPLLNTVNITSDNISASDQAMIGDMVTLRISASEILRAGQMIATIAGKTAMVTPTCGNPHCATYDLSVTLDGSEAAGPVSFVIDYQDRAGNAGTSVNMTTDGSTVTIGSTVASSPLIVNVAPVPVVRSGPGGGHSGSYSGMTREERLVHGDGATYEESLAWAQKMNKGSQAKTNYYINRNGYQVFAGYQNGRLALEDFEHRMENLVVFRGDKTDNEKLTEFVQEDLAPQQDRLKKRFQTAHEEKNYRDRLGNVRNSSRYQSLMTLDDSLSGYDKKIDVYEGIRHRKKYLDNYVNKWERSSRDISNVAVSRMRKKNPYSVRLNYNGKSVAFGVILEKDRVGPQVVKRDRTKILGQ